MVEGGLKLIDIYIKTGTLKGNSVVTLILKSQKYKWTKAFKINKQLPDNAYTKSICLDTIGTIYAIKHLKNKYRKKKITIYNESSHISNALKMEDGEFKNNTKFEIINNMRDLIGTFSDVEIKEFDEKCEFKEELEHIFIECALDDIEIDEKE